MIENYSALKGASEIEFGAGIHLPISNKSMQKFIRIPIF